MLQEEVPSSPRHPERLDRLETGQKLISRASNKGTGQQGATKAITPQPFLILVGPVRLLWKARTSQGIGYCGFLRLVGTEEKPYKFSGGGAGEMGSQSGSCPLSLGLTTPTGPSHRTEGVGEAVVVPLTGSPLKGASSKERTDLT